MLNLFRKKPTTQSEFTAGRAVSIWVGDFPDEDAFDDYLLDVGGFAADFGFVIDDRSPPEITFEEEPKDIRALLTGFSLSDQFIEAATQKAAQQSHRLAKSAAVFHFLAYDEKYIRTQKRMRYLGSFAVEGFK